VLPELEDRGACLGGADVSVGGGSGACLVCRLDKCGDMVSKPPGEGVVSAGSVEFGEDAFAEDSELVIGR
jgi:hypothetical protein